MTDLGNGIFVSQPFIEGIALGIFLGFLICVAVLLIIESLLGGGSSR